MNVLSLFAGIGGLEKGLEDAGMTTVGQVELDALCRQILDKHWPGVPKHDDVRTAPAWWNAVPRPPVDLVCGGFPCQPFSHAGKRLGLADERWGWPWFADVVRAVGPRYVVVENVAALLRDRDAFGFVLADLASLGFDAEWSVLSACAVGAPHTRERLFLVAYPHVLDGAAWLGAELRRCGDGAVSRRHGRAGAWPDPVDGVMATSREHDRVPNGTAVRLVAAGGNAVVPRVAEHVGRLVMEFDAQQWAIA